MGSNSQAIDLDKLADKKVSLKNCNDDINASFTKLEKKVDLLSQSWKCRGANEVIKNFNEHLKQKAKSRYKKQKEVIKLLNIVEQGYENTENTNKDLSSRFK